MKKETQAPGKRGGKFYNTKSGHIRYGSKGPPKGYRGYEEDPDAKGPDRHPGKPDKSTGYDDDAVEQGSEGERAGGHARPSPRRDLPVGAGMSAEVAEKVKALKEKTGYKGPVKFPK